MSLCEKNARILHNSCPKNTFSRFFMEGRGARAPPLIPVSYAYGPTQSGNLDCHWLQQGFEVVMGRYCRFHIDIFWARNVGNIGIFLSAVRRCYVILWSRLKL